MCFWSRWMREPNMISNFTASLQLLGVTSQVMASFLSLIFRHLTYPYRAWWAGWDKGMNKASVTWLTVGYVGNLLSRSQMSVVCNRRWNLNKGCNNVIYFQNKIQRLFCILLTLIGCGVTLHFVSICPSGDQARNFFLQSGLPPPILAQIWWVTQPGRDC